jgi:hypothetical protein
MTSARLDGLYLLLLGGIVFIFLGILAENVNPASMVDFRALYYPARCLIQHCDPYNEGEVLRITHAEGGEHPGDSAKIRQIVTRYIYLPTAFSFTVPFAVLPWEPAHLLWLVLIVGSLILASLLIWELSADFAPMLSGALIGLLLINSEVLVMISNAAGIAISLCAAAVWCFARRRFVPVGILCLAISLAVKPQDAGLVWLYFLLAGGVYRRMALQTLLATVALSLPAILWVWHVAPHWMQEWHSNILAFSTHGGLSDPGLASRGGGHALGMMVNLQTAISAFWDDPQIYNPVSYLVCGALLLVWGVVTLRTPPTPRRLWLGLAAIAALSMLPVYHRQQDTKLLLLTVPACAMLWAEGGLIGWFALVVNAAGFVLTGDVSRPILLAFIEHLQLATMGLPVRVLMAAQVFPTPLMLLAMGIFYLAIYLRREPARSQP